MRCALKVSGRGGVSIQGQRDAATWGLCRKKELARLAYNARPRFSPRPPCETP